MVFAELLLNRLSRHRAIGLHARADPELIDRFDFLEADWILVRHGVEEEAGFTQQLAVVERQVNLLEMTAMKEVGDTMRLVVQGVAAPGVIAETSER